MFEDCPRCNENFYDRTNDFCEACGFPESFDFNELDDVSDYDYEDSELMAVLDAELDDILEEEDMKFLLYSNWTAFCPQCDSELEDNATLCDYCGYVLEN